MLKLLVEILLISYTTFISIILLVLVWAVFIINKKKMSKDHQKNRKESSLMSTKQASATPMKRRKRATGQKPQTKCHIFKR